MSKGKTLRRLLAAATTVFLMWLAYGPVFAWSPWTPRFRTIRATRAIVLFREPPGLTVRPSDIDAALFGLQSDIGLEFREPARVVLCDNWTDLARFTPWLHVSHSIGAITLPIGLVTYVTPVVRNRSDLLDVIKHEATHTLLYQHASIRSRLEMERQAWFVEGVGAHFGNPAMYEGWDEFQRAASSVDLTAVINPAGNGNQRAIGGFRFSYSAYGYFVAFLGERFGSDKFREFVRSYASNPERYREEFQQIFGIAFEEGLHAFESRVRGTNALRS